MRPWSRFTFWKIAWVGSMLLCILFFAMHANPVQAEKLQLVKPHIRPEAIIVPVSENVDVIVSIGKPVVVRGTVTNTILSIGGPVYLAPGSRSSFVLTFLANVVQAPSATVSEGIVAFQPDLQLKSTLALAGFLGLGAYLAFASFTAILFSFLSAAGWVLSRWDEKISGWIGKRYIRILAIGLTVTIVPVAFGLASLLTPLLWIPTVLIAAIYGLAGLLGMVLIANKIGRIAVELTAGRLRISHSLIGALCITLAINVPLVGIVAFMVLWFLGMGTTLSVALMPNLLRSS